MKRTLAIALAGLFLFVGVLPQAAADPGNGNGPPDNAPANDRSRGMVYDDLVWAAEGTLCEGMWKVVEKRAGDLPGCTHGPDPAPEGVDISVSATPLSEEEAAAGNQIACEPGDDGTSGKRVHGMYVYELGQTSRYNTYLESFRTWAGNVEAAYADSAAKTGGERHVRWVHDGNCLAEITEVMVNPGDLTSIGTMRSALQAQGYNSADRKYHVWAESSVYCGVGYIYGDDKPTQDNLNNGYAASYARTDSGCWGHTNSVEAHEVMHNMGGVQPSAYYATNGYHCVDNADRMCYNDGSLKPGQTMLSICSGTERLFDCGDNDYFSTAPAPGSYLDTHWNTADSAWLFETAANPGTPAAPSGLTATATSTSSIDLAWTDNANDETSFEVQRAPGGSTSFSLIATLGLDATAYTDSGLSAGTAYDYRVRATNGNGPSGWSNVAGDATFDVPPAAPSALGASGVSESQIDLSWTDNSDNEDGFTIQRADEGLGNWATIASPGAGTTSYADTGLPHSTSYDYRVRADNSAGSSSWSNTATGTTESPAPFTDQFAASEFTTYGSVSGSFTATHDDDGSAETITESESGGKPSRRHSLLQHEWTFSVTPGDSVTLTVDAQADASSDGDDFLFEYDAGSGYQPAFTFAGDGSSSTQSASLPASTSGTVTVRVTDTDQSEGNRALDSIAVDFIRIRTDHGTATSPPAAPSGLGASATGPDSIDLSWTDNSSDESSFRIERSDDGATGWTEVGTAGADVTVFTDSGLAAETTYFYRVIANNNAGDSAASNTASATTDAAPDGVHVGDLDGSSNSKKRWSATVDILIVDGSGTPVSGALVTGSWSAGGSSSCTTDGSGWCSTNKGGLRDASVTFTVTNVDAGAAPYDAASNTDPDGDSDGTAITIQR